MLEQITQMLENLGPNENPNRLPATHLYNEGWMLRLILHAAQLEHLPDLIKPASNWFSEAKLSTPFARNRGRTAEGATSADAVLGDFEWAPGTQTGVKLLPNATRFEVFEAKMFSGLSSNVTNAKGYDQAARTIACMANVIAMSDLEIGENNLNHIHFWLIAPEDRIDAGCFLQQLEIGSIDHKVKKRIRQFQGKDRDELNLWYEKYFKPLLNQELIKCTSWEYLLDQINDRDLKESLLNFYDRCFQSAKVERKSETIAPLRKGYFYLSSEKQEEVIVCCSRKSSSRVFNPKSKENSYVVSNRQLTLLNDIDPILLEQPKVGTVYLWENQEVIVVSNGPCKSKVENRSTGVTSLIDNHIFSTLQVLQEGIHG